MQLSVLGQALDCRDCRAFRLNGKHRARLHRLTIDHHRTRAAERRFTADVRAGQVQHVAQIVNEEHAWFDLIGMRDTIHAEIDSLFHELPHFWNICLSRLCFLCILVAQTVAL